MINVAVNKTMLMSFVASKVCSLKRMCLKYFSQCTLKIASKFSNFNVQILCQFNMSRFFYDVYTII